MYTAEGIEYEDFGPVLNPDGTPTDFTVEMLTGQRPFPEPDDDGSYDVDGER
jgi:hypothetical protein